MDIEIMNIPFSPPYVDEEVINEVVSSLRSGWITTGPKVKSLEHEVSRYTQAPEVLCVNSWTSGAMLILKWFGVASGDEIIIPAYTYSATALAVIHCGATPVMVDVKDDFNIDPIKVAEKITSKTKAIIPVDIAGWLCDYEELNKIVRDPEMIKKFNPGHNNQKLLGRILLLADAAHSFGATFKGRQQGTFADITIFSFHAVKNITTAEGGAICLNLPLPFNNHVEYEYLRKMTLNGQTKDAYTKSKAGGWKYDILAAGLKINMPDICAAMGLAQIKIYKSVLIVERKRVFDYYTKRLSAFTWAILPPLDDEEHTSSYHLYALRIKEISEETRDKIIDFISVRGIGVNVHFIPLPMLTLFMNMGYKIIDFPSSYLNYSREISLPIYPQISDSKLDDVVDTLDEAYRTIV